MASVGHRVSLGVNHGVGHGVIPEDVCGHHLKICLSPHNCYKFYNFAKYKRGGDKISVGQTM